MDSCSDSSDSSDTEGPNIAPFVETNPVGNLLRTNIPHQNMTSFESVVAQLATISTLNGFPPLYPGNNMFFQNNQITITKKKKF